MRLVLIVTGATALATILLGTLLFMQLATLHGSIRLSADTGELRAMELRYVLARAVGDDDEAARVVLALDERFVAVAEEIRAHLSDTEPLTEALRQALTDLVSEEEPSAASANLVGAPVGVVLTALHEHDLRLIERHRRLAVATGAVALMGFGAATLLTIHTTRMQAMWTRRLVHMAHTDPLTGLPNRAALIERLNDEVEQARRSGGRLAVAYLDLDDFKRVNDTLGHVAGDALLVQVSDRLRSCVRAQDMVARLAGDEFVIVFPAPPEAAALYALLQRLATEMRQSFIIEGQPVRLGVSGGTAAFPDDATTVEDLLRVADRSMYRAKAADEDFLAMST